ncbi:hypothetical protein SDJN03_12197, partial [Cucurbita argyrosperma subsp. sororia]
MPETSSMPEKVKKREEKRETNDGARDGKREPRSGLTRRSRRRSEVFSEPRNQAAGGEDREDQNGDEEGVGDENSGH